MLTADTAELSTAPYMCVAACVLLATFPLYRVASPAERLISLLLAPCRARCGPLRAAAGQRVPREGVQVVCRRAVQQLRQCNP